MSDVPNESRAYGSMSEERLQKIFAVAQALGESGRINPGKWRSELSEAVVKDSGEGTDTPRKVYCEIGNLPSRILTRLRVACIGEEASNSIIQRQSRRHPGRKPRVTLATKALPALVEEVYAKAIATLPQNMRTRTELAKIMGLKLDIVDAYLFQNRHVAERLTDGKNVFDTSYLRRTG